MMNLDNREERLLGKESKTKNDEIKNIFGRNFSKLQFGMPKNKHKGKHN